ncbi:dihydrofolate reductase family protein [Bifidobacterium samirii]|uniref:Riboflavin biosynthesis protein RibD n=1 Tax=Bifidobacterium samirii TaxID=2306974 RepID=A0A430FU53_9BIFI|nr:dihydrofolate reductase family protein [Bifidobacterium samirii]RSX56530.1 riboflavin biosynthesis protein RibD [Bifidobacterium samirii]
MRNTVLFIAMSLDGYIADADGNVDWLSGQDDDVEGADGYADFIKGMDTVIMGWTTYHQVVTELSPDQWVYDGLQSYVVTHRECVPRDGISFVSEDPCVLVDRLRREPGKGIWICGGASIIHQLMQGGLIDEYRISIIPTILGSGIRLFDTLNETRQLRLVSSTNDNGIVELTYRKH